MAENIECTCPRCGSCCITSADPDTPCRCHTCGGALYLRLADDEPLGKVDPSRWEQDVKEALGREPGATALMVPREYLERALADVEGLRELARIGGPGGEESIGG